jgi:hypothetical protein
LAHKSPHTTDNTNRQQLLSTQGSPHLRDNIVSVFGAAFAGTLGPIDVAVSSSSSSSPSAAASEEEEEGEGEGNEKEEAAVLEEEPGAVTRITGFVSKVKFGVWNIVWMNTYTQTNMLTPVFESTPIHTHMLTPLFTQSANPPRHSFRRARAWGGATTTGSSFS